MISRPPGCQKELARRSLMIPTARTLLSGLHLTTKAGHKMFDDIKTPRLPKGVGQKKFDDTDSKDLTVRPSLDNKSWPQDA